MIDGSNIIITPNVRGDTYQVDIIATDNNPQFDRVNSNIVLRINELFPIDKTSTIIDPSTLFEGSNVIRDISNNFKANIPEYTIEYNVIISSPDNILSSLYTTKEAISLPSELTRYYMEANDIMIIKAM